MALVILGKSTCALCGKTLRESEDTVGLPAIANSIHPLYSYFDQIFHRQCFEQWAKKAEALRLLKEDRRAFINSPYYAEMAAKYGKPKWLDEQD